MEKTHLDFMNIALKEAQNAFLANEVPVGAAIVKNGALIAQSHNKVVADLSVSSHAEINVIQAASVVLRNYRLINCDLYVTVEPCHMCAKAIVDARIKHLYFGCLEPKSGAIQSVDQLFDRDFLNHRPQFTGGICSAESAMLLKKFFQEKRK